MKFTKKEVSHLLKGVELVGVVDYKFVTVRRADYNHVFCIKDFGVCEINDFLLSAKKFKSLLRSNNVLENNCLNGVTFTTDESDEVEGVIQKIKEKMIFINNIGDKKCDFLLEKIHMLKQISKFADKNNKYDGKFNCLSVNKDGNVYATDCHFLARVKGAYVGEKDFSFDKEIPEILLNENEVYCKGYLMNDFEYIFIPNQQTIIYNYCSHTGYNMDYKQTLSNDFTGDESTKIVCIHKNTPIFEGLKLYFNITRSNVELTNGYEKIEWGSCFNGGNEYPEKVTFEINPNRLKILQGLGNTNHGLIFKEYKNKPNARGVYLSALYWTENVPSSNDRIDGVFMPNIV